MRQRILAALLAAGATTAALAGGPIYTFDTANRIPYAWNMDSWPDGQVPVYTDLGRLGPLSGARANELVTFAVGQWSTVPTSSFRSAVVGDFSAIGLGDIDFNSVASVIGEFNGGGMHVIYDHDGSILTNFFGLPPTGVLGITNIDYVAPFSPEIVEAWMVLSGPGIHAADPNGVGFQGVVTHELGHALNLAHSQANGAVWNPNVMDSPQPAECPAPWSGEPLPSQVETMYPLSDPEPGHSGEYMGTVDRLDDRSALSDLYPGPGYPGNRGTIAGQVLDASGNPVPSVNVIARSLHDPFNDFSSYITGQVTKSENGPDGSFELNDLTPGAQYVLYVDNLTIGAFSVPRIVVLPGPEEYFNGGMESGDSALDDRCVWTAVPAQAELPVLANITFNRYAGAPTFITAPSVGGPSDITPDGSVVVGSFPGPNAPIFRWDLNADTFENIGGYSIGTPSISDDGTKIASVVLDADGTVKPAIYENGAWTTIPPVPGSTPCAQDGPPTTGSAWDISGDGSTVVGLNYGDGCYRGGVRAFKWTAAGGSVALPKSSSFNMMTRANAVNYDGSVIVGLDEATSGFWRGAYWKNGVVKLITSSTGLNVQSAVDVSRDGQYVVGQSSSASSDNAWRFLTTNNSLQKLGLIPGFNNAVTIAISDDHNVITGFTTSTATGATWPMIWTQGLHWSNFNNLLLAQGVNITDIYPYAPTGMSADGRVITGALASLFGSIPFVLKTPTAIVCHAPAGSPVQTETTVVSFPDGLDAALAGGDTLGPCACSTSAPADTPMLTVGKTAAGAAQLEWSAVGAAAGYDLVRGSLKVLRRFGDFKSATTDCLENDWAGTSREDADLPSMYKDGFWYLVRATNCGGGGTFDSGAPSQVRARDAGIQASSFTCP
jgi:uncharacterized membrane protein